MYFGRLSACCSTAPLACRCAPAVKLGVWKEEHGQSHLSSVINKQRGTAVAQHLRLAGLFSLCVQLCSRMAPPSPMSRVTFGREDHHVHGVGTGPYPAGLAVTNRMVREPGDFHLELAPEAGTRQGRLRWRRSPPGLSRGLAEARHLRLGGLGEPRRTRRRASPPVLQAHARAGSHGLCVVQPVKDDHRLRLTTV